MAEAAGDQQMTHARPSAAAARLVASGVAAVQAGRKVRYFTVADDLIRVLTYSMYHPAGGAL
jgi:hypothetical protein